MGRPTPALCIGLALAPTPCPSSRTGFAEQRLWFFSMATKPKPTNGSAPDPTCIMPDLNTPVQAQSQALAQTSSRWSFNLAREARRAATSSAAAIGRVWHAQFGID